ncbi:MAG: hypothetical protein MRY63_02025 [Neomegalonema sp.]|nr:hypothetical protein [Neomegalonema sp.]
MRRNWLAWRAERRSSGRGPIDEGIKAVLGGALGLLMAGSASAQEAVEFYGFVEFEGTLFAQEERFAQQERDDFSFAAQPSLLMEWQDGDLALTLTPFLRWDAADDARTHADLREAKIDYRSGDWDVTVGIDTVFWGKTEAVHLVDIINSADAVEGLDGEDKLGQPMLRVSRLTDIGTFTGYWLPYFRKPTAPGFGGRLRAALPVDADNARIDASGEEFAQSFALRWARSYEAFDWGVSAFHGVSRDGAIAPFAPGTVLGPDSKLTVVYDTITQLGFDGQYTSDATLWKLEVIGREGQRDRNFERQNYIAATGGLEHTLYQIAGTQADLGLVLEFAYDSRGGDALTPFEEDVIAGARLSLNDEADTALLFTASTDAVSGSTALRLEAERRIMEGWKAEIEGQAFVYVDEEEIESALQDDSFIRMKLSYFW